VFTSRPILHIHTPPVFQVELGKRQLGVGGHALVSRCPDIGQSNRKLKSALNCTVWSQCTPVPDRQADGRTDRRTSWQ